MKLTDGDAAFLLGKQGKTKMKIARVSGATIELYERDLTLEIKGTDKQCRAARKYAECVMAQRVGPVTLEDKDYDEDRTIITVPQEAIGFVTGKAGNFLRTIESEWGVIMFFVEFSDDRKKSTERLAIFGPRRGRKGATLKVMSAVEQKVPNFYRPEEYTDDPEDDGDWGVETTEFRNPDEQSYALGKMGATRRKLEAASNCILQYCGNTIVYAGQKKERKRCKEYMKWLFDQLDGPVSVPNARDREDCSMVEVPEDTIGYITGARRAALSSVEAEWGVFCFFTDYGKKEDRDRKRKPENLHIFGTERARRGAELKVMSSVETKNPGIITRDLKENMSDRRGFDSDIFRLKDEDVAYALGQKGATRMKLQKTSGCVLQYIGNYAVLAGTKEERTRAREYMQWLLAQRRGSVTVADVSRRNDVTEMHIPKQCRGYITGNRGSALRNIEMETDTYLFMALDRDGEERLLIFGVNAGERQEEKGRMRAERLVNDMVQERLNHGDRDGHGGGGGRGGGGRRGDSRRRQDSRRRDRRRDSRRR